MVPVAGHRSLRMFFLRRVIRTFKAVMLNLGVET